MSDFSKTIIGLSVSTFLFIFILWGVWSIVTAGNKAQKNNYFECLDRVDQKTCNSIFYNRHTKDL